VRAAPGHTFPTDHQYIYISGFSGAGAAPVALVAPGNVTVTRGRRTQYSVGTTNVDYSLEFSSCRETHAEFGHVRTVSASLLPQLGAFDQNCDTYSPNPGLTVASCYTGSIAVQVNAGDALGTTAGLDLSMFDSLVPSLTYANASRWTTTSDGFDHVHVVPFSDYHAEPARTTVQSLLGSFDGRVKRTVPPIGGTVATDVVGTAQGTWFNPAQPTYPEQAHLAIVPDNVDPTMITHLDGAVAAWDAGERVPDAAGGERAGEPGPVADRRGREDLLLRLVGGWGAMLLQLVDATTLRVEGRTTGAGQTCARQQSWGFTGAAFTYRR